MVSKIWQHKITGQLYAVAVDSYGSIVGALGPLQPGDIKYALAGTWESEPSDHDYMCRAVSDFRDITVILENERDRRLLRTAG